MSVKGLAGLIGKEGLLSLRERALRPRVRITDVRSTGFGRTDVLVEPLEGDGEAWVMLDSMILDSEERVQ